MLPYFLHHLCSIDLNHLPYIFHTSGVCEAASGIAFVFGWHVNSFLQCLALSEFHLASLDINCY